MSAYNVKSVDNDKWTYNVKSAYNNKSAWNGKWEYNERRGACKDVRGAYSEKWNAYDDNCRHTTINR